MFRFVALKSQSYYMNKLKVLESTCRESNASEWETLVQCASYLNRRLFLESKHPVLLILQGKSIQLKKERYSNTEVLNEFKTLLYSTIHENKQFIYKKGLEN